jgi:hypothetical protein
VLYLPAGCVGAIGESDREGASEFAGLGEDETIGEDNRPQGDVLIIAANSDGGFIRLGHHCLERS